MKQIRQPKTEKQAIVLKYITENPTMPNQTLAKIIFNKEKGLFKKIEATRTYIRDMKGALGVKNQDGKFFELPILSNQKDGLAKLKALKNGMTYRAFDTGCKMLIIDIETAPTRAYVWDVWKQNVAINQIDTDWFCLTWSAKWLFEDKVYSAKLTSNEAKTQDDSRIMKSIWKMLDDADIVVAHNGLKFDLPALNTRFVINGMTPPSPYQVIDTLLYARKKFRFSHNKLDFINKVLKLERKKDTGGFELWDRCYKGEVAALKEMEDYNVQDVRILEETYLNLRPYITPHPNLALFILDTKAERCPACGSANLIDLGKKYYTTVNAYDLLKCNDCGSSGRRRTTTLTISERRRILSSSPK